MISLYDGSIKDIMPAALYEDPRAQALSYAVQCAMQRFITYCGSISVYAMIDTADDSVLDLLAVELDAQYYDSTLGIEEKRKLIRGALLWYLRLGTPAAVRELIEAVFGEAELEEWFEYGGEPYYFKITTNATLTPEMDAEFGRLLDRIKNTRSHIEAIKVHRETLGEIYAGGLYMPNYRPAAVIDGYSAERSAEQGTSAGAAAQSVSSPAAVMDGYKTEGGTFSDEVKAGTGQISTQAWEEIREGLAYSAEAAEAITAGTAADSRYRSTIKE